jgi:hypothetical protein
MLRKLYKSDFVTDQKCNLKTTLSFFHKKLVVNKEASWLFILTFPNGGSTAFANLLGTSNRVINLTKYFEGQWLIPALSRLPDCVTEKPLVAQRKLRACWLWSANRKAPQGEFVVVEKSPDNLFRAQHILNAFKSMRTAVVIFTRCPYATCASWAKRYDINQMAIRWQKKLGVDVIEAHSLFFILGKIWAYRARLLKNALPHADLLLRYEDLTQDPIAHLSKVQKIMPQIGEFKPDAMLKVKDYEPQPITNMNKQNIKFLSTSQIKSVRTALEEENDLVKFFGYEIAAP